MTRDYGPSRERARRSGSATPEGREMARRRGGERQGAGDEHGRASRTPGAGAQRHHEEPARGDRAAADCRAPHGAGHDRSRARPALLLVQRSVAYGAAVSSGRGVSTTTSRSRPNAEPIRGRNAISFRRSGSSGCRRGNRRLIRSKTSPMRSSTEYSSAPSPCPPTPALRFSMSRSSPSRGTASHLPAWRKALRRWRPRRPAGRATLTPTSDRTHVRMSLQDNRCPARRTARAAARESERE